LGNFVFDRNSPQRVHFNRDILGFSQHRHASVIIMKTLIAAVVLLGAMISLGGCATPAYSAHERGQLIARNWGIEWREAQDDIDHALLLRPNSRMSVWHTQ